MFMRFDNSTELIENANHDGMGSTVEFRVADSRARILIPQTTEWQHIGD